MTSDPSAEYCLRWGGYPAALAGGLSELLTREAFVDVSLACDDVIIGAHKCVLSASSPLFQHILLKNPCQHPTIVLPPGLHAVNVSRLITFIYQGEVVVPHQQLPELIRTAETLQIRGLISEVMPHGMHTVMHAHQLAVSGDVVPVTVSADPAGPCPVPPASVPPPAGGGGGGGGPQRRKRRRDSKDPTAQTGESGRQTRRTAGASAADTRSQAGGGGVHPTPKSEPQGEQNRTPPLQQFDGLDMFDPTQLLGYDSSGAAAPATHRPCPVCNRSVRRRDLSRHVQRVHSERKHSCRVCSLSYGYRLDLRRHLLEKHPTESRDSGDESEPASDADQ